MPNCQECQKNFEVAPQDKAILDRLNLPQPSLCGLHSLRRRLTWRNERYLYKRTCEQCQQSILSNYSETSGMHVYCRTCWFADSWDASSFGQAYDTNRPFFEQWNELFRSVPQYNVFWAGENQNCDYANNLINSKDVYLSSSTLNSENVLYSKNTDYSKDIVDCLNVTKCELCFECVDIQQSYHSAYLTRCDNCSESYLSRDLVDCQSCFGCVNLKHKQFCWFNEQLSESEYRQRLADALKSRTSFLEQVNRFAQFQLIFPVEYAFIRNSQDSVGHDLLRSTDVRVGFNVREDENVGDVFRIHECKDLYRESFGRNGELCYENSTSVFRTRCIATLSCSNSLQVEYSMNCEQGQYLFGCVGLRGKKYYILNKSYTQSEYEVLRQKIIADMQSRGEWGEFFPTHLSPQGYNDTVAYEFWPLTQEQTKERGWRWQIERPGVKGKGTLFTLPDSNALTHQQVLKEVFTCSFCQTNYKIQLKELEILESFKLSLPAECPECRFQHRTKRTYIPELFERVCQCTLQHLGHGPSCERKLLSIYAADRPEIVFCAECYQKELS